MLNKNSDWVKIYDWLNHVDECEDELWQVWCDEGYRTEDVPTNRKPVYSKNAVKILLANDPYGIKKNRLRFCICEV